MYTEVHELLELPSFDREALVKLLSLDRERFALVLDHARKVKEQAVGNKVYFRGLVEFSNLCGKNCEYCGIRRENSKVERYSLSDEEILSAVHFAMEHDYASVVLQSGELSGPAFTTRIRRLLRQIKETSAGKIGITLSLGEQSPDVYREWKEAGAHRYLLRIESSNPRLYESIHPSDGQHEFSTRLTCLESLRDLGYQVGTGVMVGFPGQSLDDLVDDLLFMRDFDVDMVGMGPYIEHKDTPLSSRNDELWPIQTRFEVCLRMIALLRIMMKDINIAAATALQAIDPMGREKAIRIGANVLMPNITPGKYRDNYKLYENKPCTDEDPDDCTGCIDARVRMTGNVIGYGEWGDSLHFKNKGKDKG